MRVLYATLPFFVFIMSAQPSYSDICDVKLTEIAYNYVTIKSDERYLHAYERIACSIKFQTEEEARRNGFSFESLTELGMINGSGQFDKELAKKFYEEKCDVTGDFTSTADAYEYIESTVSENAVEIVKACRDSKGLFCSTVNSTDSSITFLVDWRYSGFPIRPKANVTVGNGNFLQNGKNKIKTAVKIGPNYFVVIRDKKEKEVPFLFSSDLIEDCPITQPPVPAYRIVGEISGVGSRQAILSEKKDWDAGEIDCEINKPFSEKFTAPKGLLAMGGATTVNGSCGSKAKNKLTVKNNDIVVSGTLVGCPKTKETLTISHGCMGPDHDICDRTIVVYNCKDKAHLKGNADLSWIKLESVNLPPQKFDLPVGESGGVDILYANLPEDIEDPEFSFNASIINTLDASEPAISVNSDQYVGETIFEAGSARFSFDPATGHLLVSSPKTFSTEGITLKSVLDNSELFGISGDAMNYLNIEASKLEK